MQWLVFHVFHMFLWVSTQVSFHLLLYKACLLVDWGQLPQVCECVCVRIEAYFWPRNNNKKEFWSNEAREIYCVVLP